MLQIFTVIYLEIYLIVVATIDEIYCETLEKEFWYFIHGLLFKDTKRIWYLLYLFFENLLLCYDLKNCFVFFLIFFKHYTDTVYFWISFENIKCYFYLDFFLLSNLIDVR